MIRYFSKPYSSYKDIKVELGPSNYTAKADINKQEVLTHRQFQKRLI